MPIHIGEDWGNRTPLRSPGLWTNNLSIRLQNTRFQPFPDEPEKGSVVNAPTEHLHQLVMVQVVEKAFYIGFNYVTITPLLQIEGEVLNRIQWSPSWAITVTAIQKILLINRRKQFRTGHLNQLILKRWNP